MTPLAGLRAVVIDAYCTPERFDTCGDPFCVEARGWLDAASVGDADLTTAYMVGYEKGKDFAILHARAVHGCDHGTTAEVVENPAPHSVTS